MSVEIFEKYGFAGVIVAVLAWFMLRNEQILTKLNETLVNNNRVLLKICLKLGVDDDEQNGKG